LRRLFITLSAIAALVASVVGRPAPALAAGNWPFVAPYVDMGAFPTPLLGDLSQQSGLRGFTMGFVTSVGCKASWFNAFDPRDGFQRDEVDKLRAAGGDVKISFGGAAGIELAQDCTDVGRLTTEYNAVVDAYDANFIDFDIEGAAVAEPASINRRSQAIAAVQRAHPGLKVSLTLPVLPEGLPNDELNLIRSARAAGVAVDMVNVMAMDYQRPNDDYGDDAVRAGQSTHDQLAAIFPEKSDAQLWAMTGVTPMLGENDDHGVFRQDDARQLVGFAQQHHLGELSFWEETRDRNACTGALFRCTNVPQQPFEFSKIFAQYTG
jgi:Glycosyl hydrolases family 18